MELRDYQLEAIGNIWSELQCGRNAILQAPTGAGKSIILSSVCSKLLENIPNARIVVIVDREILVTQLFETFRHHYPNIEAGICCASIQPEKELLKSIIFASRQTLVRQLGRCPPVNMIVLDEADMARPPRGRELDQYYKIISTFMEYNPRLRIFGCTATPYRLSCGYIYGDRHHPESRPYFNELTHKISFNYLTNKNYLVPLCGEIADSMVDLSSVRITGGDYNLRDLGEVMGRHIETVAQAIEKYAKKRKSILVFAVDIDHAEKITKIVPNSFVVHSKQSIEYRRDTLDKFTKGIYRVAVSVAILSVGFDHPPVDCVLMARPTMAPRLWLQMIGRGLRPSEGKNDCLLIDLVGGARQHCPSLDLDKIIVKIPTGKNGNGESAVKHCPKCGFEAHPATQICPECNYEWPRRDFEAQMPTLTGVNFGTNQPLEEEWVITRMEFWRNKGKNGKQDTLRIEYHNGDTYKSRIASEWLCLEHNGFARSKAESIWKNLAGSDCPLTIDSALDRCHTEIMVPSSIKIRYNGNFIEIIGRDYEIPF